MRRFSLTGCLLVLLVLLAGFATLGYFLLRQTLPRYTTTLSFPNLSDTVLVVRDQYGIPAVFGNSEPDVFFALGYLHAQDRLWQMDLFRRFGKGALAEILGKDFVPVDYTMRLLQLPALASKLAQQLPPTTRQALEAYASGVNAFIRTATLPLEFSLLRYSPEPWSVLDCLVLARLMAWELNLSYWTDLAFGAIADTLGVDRAMQLFPPLPSDTLPTIVDRPLNWYSNDSLQSTPFRSLFTPLSRLLNPHRSSTALFFQTAAGSNSWAIKSKDRVFLSSDPHLTYFLPPRWYAVQLIAPSLHVAGLTIPGLPFVIVGRNEAIAWGMTNMMADDCDFFVERLDSTGKFYFATLSHKRPLNVRYDTIRVRNADPLVVRIASTRHGPIITPHHLITLLAILGDTLRSAERFLHQYALAIQWTGFELTDEATAFYKLQKAQNWEEFLRALETYGSPALYLTYADTSGNLGIVPAGWLPQRNGLTVLPRPGWDTTADWKGYWTTPQLPRQKNPSAGFVFSANNPLAPRLNNGFLWEPLSRARRIQQWLSRIDHPTLADMELMQNDVQSPYAARLIRLIAAAADTTSWSAPMRQWLHRLQQWNGILDPQSPEAAFYSILRVELTRQLLQDELGNTYDLYCFTASLPTRLLPFLLTDTTYQWWVDRKETPQPETVADILTLAFRKAVDQYRQQAVQYQTDSLRYGMLHQLELYHPLGIVKFFRSLVNLGPYPIGGDNTTINHQQWSYLAPFHPVIGPSMRFLTDLRQSRWWCILPGGQSGHPLHRFYSDQLPFWLFGQLIEIPFSATPTTFQAFPFRLQMLPQR